MGPEYPVPESGEQHVHIHLSGDEQKVLNGLEDDLTAPYDPSKQPIDDKKRPPFPEEIEWGVPGAENDL